MAEFVKGDIVVVPFTFSDLSGSKRRPALVVQVFEEDLLLAQITTLLNKDVYSISIKDDDFTSGSLNRESNIRPNKLFTTDREIIIYAIGRIKADKFNYVKEEFIKMLNK